MRAMHFFLVCIVSAIPTGFSGCTFVPRSQLTAIQAHNQTLLGQRDVLRSENAGLKRRNREMAADLGEADDRLALLDEELGLDPGDLAGLRQQQGQLRQQFLGLANGRSRISPEVHRGLMELSRRHPGLQFDPVTAIGKLDTDVLFDSGEADTKPGAEPVLKDLVRVLQSPEASELKVMVVGHTDDRQIAKKVAREKFPNNFHLSTARAHAVADLMLAQGLPPNRVGVAGFGSHQPIAPNTAPEDRRKNRRVEIFVLDRDVPVVGWTESIPSLY